MFSKTCEYAIRATIYIASESSAGKRCGIRDIARKIESPEPFTAKILQRLVKADIIKSIKGNGGGFEIEKVQLKHIKLEQLVKAIDGKFIRANFHPFITHQIVFEILNNQVSTVCYILIEHFIFIGKPLMNIISKLIS